MHMISTVHLAPVFYKFAASNSSAITYSSTTPIPRRNQVISEGEETLNSSDKVWIKGMTVKPNRISGNSWKKRVSEIYRQSGTGHEPYKALVSTFIYTGG